MNRPTHQAKYGGKVVARYNPSRKPIDSLPIIFGYDADQMEDKRRLARLVSEDGVDLGYSLCKNVSHMPGNLGIIEGTAEERHEKAFQRHYPDGYRMMFVPLEDVASHQPLQAALSLLAANLQPGTLSREEVSNDGR